MYGINAPPRPTVPPDVASTFSGVRDRAGKRGKRNRGSESRPIGASGRRKVRVSIIAQDGRTSVGIVNAS